ncbi:hypothetical protein CC85DRAFT_283726 [Cutaneotrichosporon oleaginosum]|uniref:Uncharacterized protein n=1 Tax=Cutaneotrichosporon oleaginosum TaxID=879819 RepID=A0A0J0XSZ5_9TREE|nr:uncharacterized protein CC85DRAFT_283726 [Cutaneotrichosporon oleaginosum]KLT44208.1 hypothetical protein CC85DRAFT_283726 [Cutaneotrichosporon oleaginosum]TXT11623.1 hypothetical protein COLE_02033 [Cutaneotrichosporon oleaginosum]
MPPRRFKRVRDLSSEENETSPPPKRPGWAVRETPPMKTRTSHRLRESSTTNLRATRSTSTSMALNSPEPINKTPKKAMARRTGGRPMPAPPTASQRSPRFDIIPPRQPKLRRFNRDFTDELEHEPVTKARASGRGRSSPIYVDDDDDESDDIGPSRRSQRRRPKADDGDELDDEPKSTPRTRNRARRAPTDLEDEVEIEAVDIDSPRTSRRRRARANDDDELDEEPEPTPRVRTSARRANQNESENGNSEVEVLDVVSSSASLGAAGPGPSTSRNRMKLQPVPQPSPAVFRRLAGKAPQTSQVESIEDPDSSSSSSLGPQTQMEPPSKKRVLHEGMELEIFDDDDDEEDQGKGSSPLPKPEEKHGTQATADGAAGSPVAVGRRHSVAGSASWSTQSGDGARTLDFLTGELETSRAEHAQMKSMLTRTKAENAELRDNVKSTEIRGAQALAEARSDFTKQLNERQAEFDAKLKATIDEHEKQLGKAQKELEDFKAELNERIAKSVELDMVVKTTEVELMKRNTVIEGLEAQVTELKARAKSDTDDLGTTASTTVTVPADAPAEEQIVERDTIITNLRKELKRSKKAHKTTKGDLEFIRAQYETASSSAVHEVNRAKELEAEVKKLREQLTLGLKQKDMVNRAAVATARLDAEKARRQVNVLLEQNRRTDDAIRRKAAQHHHLHRERTQFEMDLHKERTRAHELSKRNDELVAQIAQLRGRLMGAFDKVEESDDDEPAAFAMPTLVPDDNRAAGPAADPTLAEEAQAWQCKWLVDNRLCGLYFDTREELDGHGQGVHISALEQS